MQQDIIELANHPQTEKVLRDFTLKPEAIDVEQNRNVNIEEIKDQAVNFETEIPKTEKQETVIKQKSELAKNVLNIMSSDESEKTKKAKLENIAKNLKFHQLEEFFNTSKKILN